MAYRKIEDLGGGSELWEEYDDSKPNQAAGSNLYETYVASNPQANKPTYAGTYEGQLSDLYGKIANRGPFSYDATKDPLYQGYKDQYIQGGKLAMKDTMGQAAALTGGYGSTYGQAVGQQAYDAYLQKLGEVIPTLYGMAYDQYKDAGDQMLQQYNMLGDLRDQEYGRYRDLLGDWESERSYTTALEQEDYNRRIAAEKTAYDRQQDAYANLYAAIKASGYYPSDEELQAAGMSRAAADAIAAEYQRGVDLDERTMALKEMSAYGGGSSGGGGGGGGSSGGGGGGYYVDVGSDGSFTYHGGSLWQDAKDDAAANGPKSTLSLLSNLHNSGAIDDYQYSSGVVGVGAAGLGNYANAITNYFSSNNNSLSSNSSKSSNLLDTKKKK